MAPRKKKEKQVTALIAFTDALTGKSFKVGEAVEGWDEARAKHYQDRGLVIVKEIAPAKKETPKKGEQMTIDNSPEGQEPEETENRPGPEETKPETGGSETK